MRCRRPFRMQCLLLLICIFMISGCATLFPPGKQPAGDNQSGERNIKRRPEVQERIELQASLMSFADRFATGVTETISILEHRISDPELRLKLANDRLYNVASLYDIVAGPYVGVALFDTLVLVSLTRMVWEDYWILQVFGEQAAPMLTTYRTLEDEIWSLAAKYLTAEQAQALRESIVAWRKEHPDAISVSYIRFGDFGELGRRPTLEEAREPGGILAPISEATEAVDEIRLLGERAMFLLSRNQLLINFQIEVAFRKLAVQPEIGVLLADIQAFRNVSERYAEIMVGMPQELRETSEFAIDKVSSLVKSERSQAIDQVMTRLSTERQQLIADIADEEQRLNRLLPEIKNTLDAGTSLMAEVNRTMVSLEPLLASMRSEKPGSDAEPMKIKEIAETSRQVTEMVNALERLLVSPGWSEQGPGLMDVVHRMETSSQKILDSTFRNMVILVLVFMASLLVTLLVYRMITERVIQRNDHT
jgi:hypothetical protein